MMMNMLSNLVGPVTGLLDKFIEDKDQKNKLAHEIATMAEKQSHEVIMAQIEVLKADAKGNLSALALVLIYRKLICQ